MDIDVRFNTLQYLSEKSLNQYCITSYYLIVLDVEHSKLELLNKCLKISTHVEELWCYKRL